jgi:hypothetical protein
VAWRRAGRGRRDGSQAGQRLLVEGMDQDRFDRVVAILADGVGAGTGSIEAGRTVALSQPQDALGAPEAIERTIAEQGVDEMNAGPTDLGGLRPTPGRCLHEEVDFVGR